MRDHETDVHQKLLGRAGERLTEKRYKKAGYEILARNLKTPFGEADLVAKKGDTVAFVEVKTRARILRRPAGTRLPAQSRRATARSRSGTHSARGWKTALSALTWRKCGTAP